MKKIAFILPYIPVIPSGGVIVVFKYAEKLSQRNNNVTIYFKSDMVWNEKKIKIPFFVRKIIATIGTYISPRWYKLNPKILKRPLFSNKDLKDTDIVIATGVETAKLTASSNIKEKFYLIQDFENWSLKDDEVLETYKLGMKNIVISKWLSDIVQKETHSEPYFVPDGINTSIFKNNTPILKRNNHSIVFQYRSAPGKGCEYALQVIEKLKDKYSDLSVSVVSKDPKSQSIPNWCFFYEKLKLEEVCSVNNQNQIFICSSVKEGFGLPGLEAMACGCCVVSTDYQGGKEYIINDYNSMVSEVGDVEKMIENIIFLFENPDLMVKLSNNGIKTAIELSDENSSDKFSKIVLGDS